MDEKKIKENNWKKWMFYFSICIAVIVIYKILDNFTNIGNWIRNLFKVLAPFVGGIVMAYILYLPCKTFEESFKKKKKKSFTNKHARILSIATVYILVIAIIVIIFSFVLPILVRSLTDLVSNIPNYYNTITEQISELPEDNILRSDAVNNAIGEVNKIDFKSFLDINKIAQYLKGIISFATSIFNIFIAIVVSIYILTQRSRIVKELGEFNHAIMSQTAYNKLRKYFRNGNEIFFRFLTGQIIDAFVVGTLVSIAMLILKVRYAVLLGFMIGLFNLIPFFGAIIGVIIAIIVTALTGGIGQAIVMALIVIVLQQIDANIINPKIVGSFLNISQLLIIFAVTIGGAYFGILGMFLAVPVVTIIKMMIKDFVDEKEAKKLETTIDNNGSGSL